MAATMRGKSPLRWQGAAAAHGDRQAERRREGLRRPAAPLGRRVYFLLVRTKLASREGFREPCRTPGHLRYSSPITVDRAADGSEDQCGRPAEHQRTASGPQRAKDAVARRQHDIAVTQRREGDEREVEGIGVGLEGAEKEEEPSPQSHLREWPKNSGSTAPSEIQ